MLQITKKIQPFLLLITIVLYLICFYLNWGESNRDYPIKMVLSVFYICFLLLTSFFYGYSNGYLLLISFLFCIVLVTTLLGMIFRSSQAIWKYIFIMPSMAFLTPLTPILRLFDYRATGIILIIIVYVMMFVAHRLGKIQLRKGKYDVH